METIQDVSVEEVFNTNSHILIAFINCEGQTVSYKTVIKSLEEFTIKVQTESPLSTKDIASGMEVTLINLANNGNTKYLSVVRVLELEEKANLLILKRPFGVKLGFQRRYFRVDTLLPMSYTCHDQTYPGTITNLSEGGFWAVIRNNSDIEQGSKITCEIDLSDSDDSLFKAEGKVARIQTLIEDDDIGIGVGFNELTATNRENLIKYIFNRQRELLHIHKDRNKKK